MSYELTNLIAPHQPLLNLPLSYMDNHQNHHHLFTFTFSIANSDDGATHWVSHSCVCQKLWASHISNSIVSSPTSSSFLIMSSRTSSYWLIQTKVPKTNTTIVLVLLMKYFHMDRHGTAPSADVVHKVVHKLQQPRLHGRGQWYCASSNTTKPTTGWRESRWWEL